MLFQLRWRAMSCSGTTEQYLVLPYQLLFNAASKHSLPSEMAMELKTPKNNNVYAATLCG